MSARILTGGLAALAAAVLLHALPARADGIEAKAAVCGACHGSNGVPANKSIPVIWGQNEGYLYLEMRDYKVGNRKNITMTALAASLDKQTMKELAAYFSAKPWPQLTQASAGPDEARHAQTIDGSAGCKGCHGDAWQGDSVTPRVGGQGIQYLRETMAAFRGGDRTNNPWMAALLKTYTDADIDALAKYLAGY